MTNDKYTPADGAIQTGKIADGAIVSDDMTYEKAVDKCYSLLGHLAIINSRDRMWQSLRERDFKIRNWDEATELAHRIINIDGTNKEHDYAEAEEALRVILRSLPDIATNKE